MFQFTERLFIILLSLCIGGILTSCASPRTPTGGPKDEVPPSIVSGESTPNQQTHFKEREIILTFDEWITLKDVYNQLVVSPVLPDDPEIKQRGKNITISLPDSLREETTYTFNFGNAIADLNEGNILENYSFVFSTGAVLDSARLSGLVTDAVTLKPADGIWVMLHPFGIDSAVYKIKPEYLAKTNKEGRWTMSNIRPDTFSIVALKDENLNFLYDQETELFGWLEDTINTINPAAIVPEIRVFPREKKTVIREVIHAVPGWIKLVIQSPIPKPIPDLVPSIDSALTTWDGDTLHVWYPPDVSYSGQAILLGDTTQIRVSAGKSQASSKINIQMKSGRLHPSMEVIFTTRIPISSIDTSKISLTLDSVGEIKYQLTQVDSFSTRLGIRTSWVENKKYQLTFWPGAIYDFWGRTHDTIRHFITVNAADQFGDLTLIMQGLDSLMSYVVLIKSGEQIAGQFAISHVTDTRLTQPSLLPGKYTIEVIEDRNGNRVWDTGSYLLGRQPEKKKIFTPENLRAGWELEAGIPWH